jgi:hypothetical protein
MIKKFTEEDYIKAKEKDLLELECEVCKKIFKKTKINIRNAMNPKRKESCKHCSQICSNISKIKLINVNCITCNKEILRHPSQLKLYPLSFCGKSCASKYSNTHKKTGSNRSKLELWLEAELSIIYPNIQILYNNVDTINAELDIYIPSLNVAFEINGIFHYEPIFGNDKLNKTQFNDQRKFKLCNENNIGLCVIDTSEFKYFKPEKAKKYLDIITNIINEQINYEKVSSIDQSPVAPAPPDCPPLKPLNES